MLSSFLALMRRSRSAPEGRIRPLCIVLAAAFVLATGTPMARPGSALAEDGGRLQPDDFVYLGAFRLPETGQRPTTFDYAGNGMAFNPMGDDKGGSDGFPGSLILTGHERIPGDVPDGDQLAEVSIPAPVRSKSPDRLATARLLRGFTDTFAGRFPGMSELPTIGLAYLDRPATGPKLHVAWGQHFEPDPPEPTHAWLDLDLTPASFRGAWFIGRESFYSVNGYLFEIPQDWADAHVGGRPLATGRFRDGGWSGMGPALMAYRPWTDSAGTPPADGAHLTPVTLLHYRSSTETEAIEGALQGYQQPDEWEGAAWITTKSGKSAVLFAGTKGVGAKYWYGFVNPAGPEQPCVYQEVVGQYPACRLADGAACPARDLVECKGHDGARGWWSSAFEARFMLYDPAELAEVAAGRRKPYEPQPYAHMRIDQALRLDVDPSVADWIGSGAQRRQRIGPIAYDRAHQLLYVIELFGDGAKPLIHVWRID